MKGSSCLLFVTLCSCANYDGIALSEASATPVPCTVSESGIVIPQGIAVAVEVEAKDVSSDPNGESLSYIMTSANSETFAVGPTTKSSVFVVTGGQVGKSELRVIVVGWGEEQVPVEVVAQGTTGP